MLNHKNRSSSRTSDADSDAALRLLNRPRRLTQAGMAAEHLCKAFWPLWTSLATGFGAAVFLAPLELPAKWLWTLLAIFILATVFSLFYAARRFHWPTKAEAEARLDQSLPGRPIETLSDMQAIGSGDAQSRDVWRAHLRRIAERAKGALPVWPRIRIAERDPFALRYVATLVLAVALLFGGVARVSQIADAATPGGAAIATGPAWEGWIEPPLYTAKPSLYLNDLTAETVSIPEGSRLTLRLYAPDGDLSVSETLSGEGPKEPSTNPVQEIIANRSGALTVEGEGGRTWAIDVVADEAPLVRVDGPASRSATGEMTLPFSAQDDFAVIGGDAVIDLDLSSVERRHGLAVEPEHRDALSIPLPMTITGDRSDFTEDLVDDFSQHPWANLPITVEITVEDDLAQTGMSESYPMVLPGRRFFDPMAKAIIEQRRDLLWSRKNGKRANQILRAVSHRPDGFISNDKAYLILTTALSRLDVALEFGISEEVRDEVSEMLWQAAVQFEDGDLADAAERLRRAQDRLSEAMRDGASDEEIAELMRELREAMQDYMQQLAEQMQRDQQNGEQQQAENQPMQEITGDQLQEMLDRLQELMEQGRMDEAQALLDQLMQMMQNMQMAQNQPGQGQGDQSMEGLQQTLRDQQGLADDSFQDFQQQQDGQSPSQQPGQQPGQGQQPNPNGQNGQQGQGGQGQPDENSLAQRQQDLRDLLSRQTENLPGAGTEAGEAARDALDRAGRSMEDAAEALEENDLAEALNNQSQAMDELREGMRNLGEALAEMQQGQPGSEQGQASTGNRDAQRDPLGREAGSVGRLGTDENLLQGEDRYRRARELLDEIRRRSGEQQRPDIELDYLKRLLDRF